MNLPATLLAFRNITHETTEFCPEELIHEKNLRIPEVFLYEHCVIAQEADSCFAEYAFELINQMRWYQDLAIEKMTGVRDKIKVWYDKNLVRRKFQVRGFSLVSGDFQTK
ncbi:hypothetical protein AVEN_268970-1 [Araneus ventricosus]|uniref:Uncharacterized protein n=1 Tax=Araneus ventricosus TaxID=182803 RepID=A0A4Y2I261_ARAVE|nr:hypothetical protein AVEN_268970-1 [Araneus ventricosus]